MYNKCIIIFCIITNVENSRIGKVLIPSSALEQNGFGKTEAGKQASIKYLDKFGQPASDNFAMMW